jgi:hypothetical protein
VSLNVVEGPVIANPLKKRLGFSNLGAATSQARRQSQRFHVGFDKAGKWPLAVIYWTERAMHGFYGCTLYMRAPRRCDGTYSDSIMRDEAFVQCWECGLAETRPLGITDRPIDLRCSECGAPIEVLSVNGVATGAPGTLR